MKIILNYRMIVFFVLIIGLSGCTTPNATHPPTQLSPTQIATPHPPTQTATSPPPTLTTTLPPVCQALESQENHSDQSGREVVLEMVERMNVGDVEGALAYFAEDALVYLIGVPPTGFELIRGKEAICRTWVDYVSDNLEWKLTIISANNLSNGILITAKSTTWLDFTRQIDVAPNDFSDVFVVEDGKITEFTSTMKEESFAKFRPLLSDIFPPPEPTPDTSSETPGSELSIIFADHTCTYEGPVVWQSGVLEITWEVKDQDGLNYALAIMSLDEGKDFLDLAVASAGHAPPWLRLAFLEELGPGESKTYQHLVGQKPLYVMCLGGKAGVPIGFLGPFEVRP